MEDVSVAQWKEIIYGLEGSGVTSLGVAKTLY